MESALLFLVGQGAIALGAYLLARTLPWTVVAGAALLVEGAVAVVYGMVLQVVPKEGDKPWHGGE
jgi:hypothetical protein